MVLARAFALALLVVAAQGASTTQKVNPVQKVISLLSKMQEEVQEEGTKEAAAYDKFACFCKATADSKLNTIKKGHEHVELLEAAIEALETDIAALAAETAETREEIADVKATMEEEVEKRASEFAIFQSDDNDLQGAIGELQRAIEKLSGAKSGMVGAKTLFQKSVKTALKRLVTARDVQATPKDLKAIYALIQDEDANPGDAHAFEFQSNKHLDVLKKLLKQYKKNQFERQTDEENTKHAFNSAQSARAAQVRAFETLVAKNEEIQANKEQDKSAKEAEKTQTEADTTADQVFLDGLVAACEQKAADWDSRSEVRSNELTAMSEALGLLKGGVAGNYAANKKLNLVAQSKKVVPAEDAEENAEEEFDEDVDNGEDVSFLQQRRKKTSNSAMRKQVLKYLGKQAKLLKSQMLSNLVMKIKEDHFKKVRDMIKDMVARLESEAEAEASQKAWCDEEMSASTDKRDTQQARIESETARITQNHAMTEKLTEEISDLGKGISELYKALNEQTQLRAEDKDENTKTVADAKAGLSALQGALKVLKDFYNDPAGLLQTYNGRAGYEPFKAKGSGADGKTVSDMAPSVAEGDYEGKQQESQGIIGLLNVIESDFERTIKTTEKAEEQAQKDFDKFKIDTETDIDEKKSSKADKESELGETKADLTEGKDERQDATVLKGEALAELEKLKPSCVSTGSSYEEKVARRKMEIEALKEATRILTDMR